MCRLLELMLQRFGGAIFGRIMGHMLVKDLLPIGFPIGMIALTTSSSLFILDRMNLNPLFCCTMMRGGCGKITLGSEHQDGVRMVATLRLFHVYDFFVK